MNRNLVPFGMYGTPSNKVLVPWDFHLEALRIVDLEMCSEREPKGSMQVHAICLGLTGGPISLVLRAMRLL